MTNQQAIDILYQQLHTHSQLPLVPKKSAASLHLLQDCLWDVLLIYQNHPFQTVKGLEFTYHIKGNEMFFTRKDKSVTRATVNIALEKALEFQDKTSGNAACIVTGPKKLGCFGASYLYPIFMGIGLIQKKQINFRAFQCNKANVIDSIYFFDVYQRVLDF